MDAIAYAISAGWAAGISAYGTVLVLGIAGRTGLAETPDAFQRTDVLIVVAVLAVVEFVADKIPYVDSLWDTVNTAVRPIVAIVVGLLFTADASSGEQALGAALAGGMGLLAHGAKAGIRLAVNSSPEPASNVAVSTAEDFSVVGVLLLATQLPWVAAGIAVVLLAAALGLAWWLLSRIRNGWRRLRERYFQMPGG